VEHVIMANAAETTTADAVRENVMMWSFICMPAVSAMARILSGVNGIWAENLSQRG
jgi:hypothetical protein